MAVSAERFLTWVEYAHAFIYQHGQQALNLPSREKIMKANVNTFLDHQIVGLAKALGIWSFPGIRSACRATPIPNRYTKGLYIHHAAIVTQINENLGPTCWDPADTRNYTTQREFQAISLAPKLYSLENNNDAAASVYVAPFAPRNTRRMRVRHNISIPAAAVFPPALPPGPPPTTWST